MKKTDQAKILARSIYQSLADSKVDTKTVVANFLAYLSEHRLNYLIKQVLSELENLYLIENNMIAAQVVSRHDLSAPTLQAIKRLIKEKTDKEPIIKTEIDKTVWGGAVVKYGDKLIDFSLRKQLNYLANKLKN